MITFQDFCTDSRFKLRLILARGIDNRKEKADRI